MIRKKILVLVMILMFVMSASIALGAIKKDAKRTGYHNPLHTDIIHSSIDNDFVSVADNLLINSGNNLVLASNPGSGSTPSSYIYQGVAGSGGKQYSLAIHDSLWITRNTFLDEGLEVGGEVEFKDNVFVDGDVRVKDSSYEIQSSNTKGGWARGLHLYDDGDSRIGSIGFYMSDGDLNRVYLSSTGSNPWNNGELMLKNGRVGIGTTNPSTTLDVDGSILSDEISSDEYCIGSDCITAWNDAGNSEWSKSGNDIYYNDGDVGIGTSSPVAKLDVRGNIRVDDPTDANHVATKDYVDSALNNEYENVISVRSRGDREGVSSMTLFKSASKSCPDGFEKGDTYYVATTCSGTSMACLNDKSKGSCTTDNGWASSASAFTCEYTDCVGNDNSISSDQTCYADSDVKECIFSMY